MDVGEMISYATIAMKKLGYNNEEIEKVTNEMLIEARTVSEDSAESLADKIIYGDR